MNRYIKPIVPLLLFALLLAGQPSTASAQTGTVKKGMIKVTVLYPNAEGKTFDMDYYLSKHMPLVAQSLGDSLKFYEVDKGLAGGAPGAPIPYLAIGYLYFDKLSAFQNSFAPYADKIRNDIPNFTNIQPVIQISVVMH